MPAADKPPHLFADMLTRVRDAAAPLVGSADLGRVLVEPPRDPTHGDMATNAAMVLAKDAGKKPRELAEAIAETLRADAIVAKVDVAGPGFINLTLKPHVWVNELRRVLIVGAPTGAATSGRARRSMSNTSRSTRPVRCMSAMGAVRCSAMRSPICWPSAATT